MNEYPTLFCSAHCPKTAITSLIFYAEHEFGIERVAGLLRLSIQESLFRYCHYSGSIFRANNEPYIKIHDTRKKGEMFQATTANNYGASCAMWARILFY